MDVNEDILFTQIDNFYVYQSYNEQGGMYYLCIPIVDTNQYEMFLGFPKKDLTSLTKDKVIEEIKDTIVNVSDNGIYIIPDISVSELSMAANENDNKLYNIILEKIYVITSSVYKKITTNKKNMNSTIYAFKQNHNDTKFIDWSEIQLGSKNIQGINLMTLRHFDNDYNEQESQDDSWTTIDGRGNNSGDINKITHVNNEHLAKKRVLSKSSHGFSSIYFVVLVLVISLVVGIGIGCFLLR